MMIVTCPKRNATLFPFCLDLEAADDANDNNDAGLSPPCLSLRPNDHEVTHVRHPMPTWHPHIVERTTLKSKLELIILSRVREFKLA